TPVDGQLGAVVETKSPHIPAGSIPAFLLQIVFFDFY
ncbi:hypothetical protein SEET0821_00595, partial [Salmonella enterica subsp. enterica serovar Tennessee str. TXSC_TXSC08-21]